MTEETAARLNYLLEGPEDAPVLVLSNSLGATLGMRDDQAPVLLNHLKPVMGKER